MATTPAWRSGPAPGFVLGGGVSPEPGRVVKPQHFQWDAPRLAGRVKLSAIVDARGRVRNVSSAGSELSDPMALECFVREAAELTISPPPAAPKSVRVELELRP